jgi:hypothetical protein
VDFKVGHGHCLTCGTCFINGFTKESHPCRKPLPRAIEKVMDLDTQGPAGRARYKRSLEFKREVAALGFQIQD